MRLISDTAMVLAAGLGKRMRPLTLTKPKPLQEVGGRTMLDHALDKCVAAGIKRVVVNTYYLAEQIEAHLAKRTDLEIVTSRETTLLDTGGGIKKVLPYFDNKPFFCLNADLPWMEGSVPSLKRMMEVWNPEIMEALLLLMPTHKARGFADHGDFWMEKNGRVWRMDSPRPRPYVWISAQILTPNLFKNIDKDSFSNNEIWDNVERHQELYGLEHDGTCYHVGTPEDLTQANDLLASGQGWG